MTRLEVAVQLMAAFIITTPDDDIMASSGILAEDALEYADALIEADRENPGPYIADDNCYGCRIIGSKGPEHIISCQNYRFWRETDG